MLRESVDLGCKNNNTLVDTILKEMVELAWVNIYESLEVCKKIHLSADILDNERYLTIAMLLTNCTADLVAATQSARSGFYRPAAVIARGALENLAVAVVLNESEDRLREFNRGSLESNKAIGLAKKYFKEFGETYGFLSKFAHEPSAMVSRSSRQEGPTVTLMVVPSLDRTTVLGLSPIFLSIGCIANLSSLVGEWAFVDHLQSLKHWVRQNTELTQVFSDGAKLIQAAAKAESNKISGSAENKK